MNYHLSDETITCELCGCDIRRGDHVGVWNKRVHKGPAKCRDARIRQRAESPVVALVESAETVVDAQRPTDRQLDYAVSLSRRVGPAISREEFAQMGRAGVSWCIDQMLAEAEC